MQTTKIRKLFNGESDNSVPFLSADVILFTVTKQNNQIYISTSLLSYKLYSCC